MSFFYSNMKIIKIINKKDRIIEINGKIHHLSICCTISKIAKDGEVYLGQLCYNNQCHHVFHQVNVRKISSIEELKKVIEKWKELDHSEIHYGFFDDKDLIENYKLYEKNQEETRKNDNNQH